MKAPTLEEQSNLTLPQNRGGSAPVRVTHFEEKGT